MADVELRLVWRGPLDEPLNRHLLAVRVLSQATGQASRSQEGGELELPTLPGSGAWSLEVFGD